MPLIPVAVALAFFSFPRAFAQYVSLDEIKTLQLSNKARAWKKSKLCGDFYILQEEVKAFTNEEKKPLFLSYAGPQFIKYKRKFPRIGRVALNEHSYHTPQAQFFLNQAEALHWSPKQVQHQLRQILASYLQSRAQATFQADTAELTQVHEGPFGKSIDYVQASLFGSDGKHPNQQIKLMLTFYPELRRSIIDTEQEALRPLLCLYEHKEHQHKIMKRWSHLLVLNAVVLGATMMIVGSHGLVIPPLVISAGVAAALVGIRDMTFGILNWSHKEKAGKIAARFKLLLKEIHKSIKALEKKARRMQLSEDECQLLSRLKELKQGFASQQRKRLNKIICGKHFNRMMIAFGLLNAGFNGLNLSGDPSLLIGLPKILLGWLNLS